MNREMASPRSSASTGPQQSFKSPPTIKQPPAALPLTTLPPASSKPILAKAMTAPLNSVAAANLLAPSFPAGKVVSMSPLQPAKGLVGPAKADDTTVAGALFANFSNPGKSLEASPQPSSGSATAADAAGKGPGPPTAVKVGDTKVTDANLGPPNSLQFGSNRGSFGNLASAAGSGSGELKGATLLGNTPPPSATASAPQTTSPPLPTTSEALIEAVIVLLHKNAPDSLAKLPKFVNKAKLDPRGEVVALQELLVKTRDKYKPSEVSTASPGVSSTVQPPALPPLPTTSEALIEAVSVLLHKYAPDSLAKLQKCVNKAKLDPRGEVVALQELLVKTRDKYKANEAVAPSTAAHVPAASSFATPGFASLGSFGGLAAAAAPGTPTSAPAGSPAGAPHPVSFSAAGGFAAAAPAASGFGSLGLGASPAKPPASATTSPFAGAASSPGLVALAGVAASRGSAPPSPSSTAGFGITQPGVPAGFGVSGFGAPAAAPLSGGFGAAGFGAAAAPPATGLGAPKAALGAGFGVAAAGAPAGFGAPAAPVAPAGFGSFGSTGFGAGAPPPPPGFGAAAGFAAAPQPSPLGGGFGQGGFGQPGFGQAGFGVGGAPAAGGSVPAMQAEITSIVQRANPQSLAKIQGFFNK